MNDTNHPTATPSPAALAIVAIVSAATDWGSERTINDWDEAELMKAIATYHGNWQGCEECDHDCDEPCMPHTVAEAHRAIDSRIDKDRPSNVGTRCLVAGYPKAWAPVQYEADGSRDNWISVGTVPGIPEPGKLRPSMFMCRWLSRIDLEVCSVRIERLQDISEADAIAEGIERNWSGDLDTGPNGYGGEGWIPECGWRHYLNSMDGDPAYTAVESYRSLWEHINGAGSWDANPWVWVVSFRRITP